MNPLILIENCTVEVQNKKISHKILNSINFSVNEGDFYGILGKNGSGKTSLIRLMSKIYPPTSGFYEIKNSFFPFITIGTGANGELSGMDNLFLLGIFYGISKKEINNNFELILEFSELGDDIFKQFKNYSSGMKARLVFSLLNLLNPEIVLIDEKISAGDENFQNKIIHHPNSFFKKAKCGVFASHSNGHLKRFCNKGIVMDQGKIVFNSTMDEAIDFYKKNYVQK
tara:strand:- start:2292 stop:2972 length:681 start_codon:yes stop_codon:yes gene_type:complete